MIVIPFDKKIDWKAPPAITFLLILINISVYFSFQLHDDDKFLAAHNYYQQSGLDEIELPYYKKSLIKQDITSDSAISLFQLEANKSFMLALENEQIITPTHPDYEAWKQKRAHLNEMMSNIVTREYSFKTGAPTLLTLFSHMFLHADLSHLLGNMLFLLAVGFIVEQSMTRSLYLSSYLLCGIFSALFTIPTGSESLISSIGASGAISGLMGMYAVIFGTRKVSFFYFIYIYFDYIRLPAIYLLVVWLAYELVQQLAYSSVSNINYLAHVGGLLSGAIIAYTISKVIPKHLNHHYLDERAVTDEFTQKLQHANRYITALDYDKAAPLFTSLLHEQPDNREVLYGYYITHKLHVGSVEHHHAASLILSLTDRDVATIKLITDVFEQYSTVGTPHFTVITLNNLMRLFTTINAFKQAEKVAEIMQNHPEKIDQLPNYIGSLINKLLHTKQQEKALAYCEYLTSVYPNHPATELAKKALSS